eukprot:2151822-Lingulodinium_polyedra.AAC.1
MVLPGVGSADRSPESASWTRSGNPASAAWQTASPSPLPPMRPTPPFGPLASTRPARCVD